MVYGKYLISYVWAFDYDIHEELILGLTYNDAADIFYKNHKFYENVKILGIKDVTYDNKYNS